MYAKGPGSYLFSGTVEQTYIPHAIAYAACISDDISHCEKPPSDDACASAPVPPLYPMHIPHQPPPPDPAPVEERKRNRDHHSQTPWNIAIPVQTCERTHLLSLLFIFILQFLILR